MFETFDPQTGERHESTTVEDFLTDDEISCAFALYRELVGTGKFDETVNEKLIQPNLERIERDLGREVSPRELVAMVHAMILTSNS
jgi:hypothetical protein